MDGAGPLARPLPLYTNLWVQHGTSWPLLPSHELEPMSQPLLNQKQAWPLEPVRLRSSTAPFDGIGHHGSKGSGWGTAPPHGCLSESTAFRGLGIVRAECAEAAARQEAIIIKPTLTVPGAWLDEWGQA